MFTGLIEGLGRLSRIDSLPQGRRFWVQLPAELQGGFALGDSLALNGVCTTVVAIEDECVAMDLSVETLRCTLFGESLVGDSLNLERPLLPTQRLGGHFVSGHVDGVLTLKARHSEGISEIFEFHLPESSVDAALIVPKGSICLNGISLTVNRLDAAAATFEVCIIPHTLAVTNLGAVQAGDGIHYETDLLAKHLARLLEQSGR